MKDFFENFGKRFGETAEMVTNKAGEMIEIQRVKSQIRDLARENAVDMMELGKAVYERYKSGEELDDSTAQICDSIKEREKEIEKYERKIAVLKGSAACVKCGRMVSEDMAYCPYCGEKMEARDMEEATEEYAEKVKEKAADVAEAMADKAEETAKKIGEAAQKAAYKTEEVLEKAADKTTQAVHKAAEKTTEAVHKAAEKLRKQRINQRIKQKKRRIDQRRKQKMRQIRQWRNSMKIRWFPITAALAAADQAAKCYAENKLAKGEERAITDKVVLRHVQNEGVCMSLLEDEPETARILAGAASGAVLGWHAFTVVTKKKRFWKKAGLSLMAAGSISNMFDRLVRGHVVDYVGFRLEDKHLEGITYNFADFFIAAGAVITVMTKLFRPGSKKKKKAKTKSV